MHPHENIMTKCEDFFLSQLSNMNARHVHKRQRRRERDSREREGSWYHNGWNVHYILKEVIAPNW